MALTGLPPVSAPLPWQGQEWTRLVAQLDKGQLPHALLLAGVRHTGKSRLALALARLLLCRQPAGGLNCGSCHACELSAGGSHGDFRWLQPEEKSRVIKIDQVRAAVDFANKTASLGQRKVVVLAPADAMNSNAANALLKSLEEPAPDTHLVLVCHRLHALPATIRSRCQMLKLPVPDQGESLAWLDQISGNRERSEQLLELARGLPLLAEQLYREGGAEQAAGLQRGLQEIVRGRLAVPEAMALLGDMELDDSLAQIAEGLQDMVRALPPEELAGRRAQRAFRLQDEVTRLRRAVTAGANPNRQMLLEALLAKMGRELGEAAHGGSIRY